MRFKKIVSLLCIASLIASQGSVAAVSYLSESEDTPPAETEVVEAEKTKVYIGGIDSEQEKFEEKLLNYIKDKIKINSKTYDGTIKAEVDFSGVELNVVSEDSKNVIISDKLTLAATAEFDDKNAGKGKAVTIKDFTLKKIETTDVNEDESTDVNQGETTDVNENESTDVNQGETENDIKAVDYKLDIPENFFVEIKNAADISKKEIIIEPVDNDPHFTKDTYPVTLYNKEVPNDEVMDSDNVKIETEKYKIYIIEKTDNQYIYSFNDTDDLQIIDYDLNDNYSLKINPEIKPTVNEPDQPIINAAVVTTINDEQAETTNGNATNIILNADDSAIYANGNVKLILSATTKQTYSVNFTVKEDGGDVSKSVTDFEEKTDENNNKYYIFKTEFDVKIPDGMSCYDVKLKCTANNGTESESTQLKYKLSTDASDKEPVGTLILDNQAPSFAKMPEYNEDGSIKKDEQGNIIYTDNIKVEYNYGIKDEKGNTNYHNVHVTGAITDNLSGVAKIEYQWDNDNKYTLVNVNNSIEKDNAVFFGFSTSYDYLPKNSKDGEEIENGVHTLYLRITDNAGNVYTTNGTFCDENDGMDTEAPKIDSISLSCIKENITLDIGEILHANSFGFYTNETLILNVQVSDQSESNNESKNVTVSLVDENNSDKLVSSLKGDKSGQSGQCFNFDIGTEEDKSFVIDKLSIKLVDDYGNEIKIPLRQALINGGNDDLKWNSYITDKWVFDKHKPNISVNYNKNPNDDNEYYYNNEDKNNKKTIEVTLKDDQALKNLTVIKKYKGNYIKEIKTYNNETNETNEITYTINTSDTSKFNSGEYEYEFALTDQAGNTTTNTIIFYVDHEVPTGTIDIINNINNVNNVKEINGEKWMGRYDKNGNLVIKLTAENNSSPFTKFDFDVNGQTISISANDKCVETTEDNKTIVTLTLNPADYPTDDKNTYNISATLYTKSGNTNTSDIQYTLHVDKGDPSIGVFTIEKTNNQLENIINILTFGIFFNDEIKISVEVTDGENDVGIDCVEFYYTDENGTKTNEKANKGNGNNYYITLPKDTQVFQRHITVKAVDKLDKFSQSDLHVKNVIADKEIESNNFVMIETNPPENEMTLPKSDYEGTVWYKAGEYNEHDDTQNRNITLKVCDKHSGIRNVKVTLNGNDLTSDNTKALLNTETTSANDSKITEEQCYYFSVDKLAKIAEQNDSNKKDGGEYTLTAEVVDNAGNVTTKEVTFYRDVTKPEVTGFNFEETSQNSKDNTDKVYDSTDENKNIIKMPYGYYFKEPCNITVVAKDDKASSGLKEAKIKFMEYDGDKFVEKTEYEKTVVMTKMENESGTENKAVSDEVKIPDGFKGMIIAKVTDNTGNVSDEKTPYAFVVDNDKPTIEISDFTETPLTDDNGNKLYTSKDTNKDIVSFTVTITDEKSGLKNIVYEGTSENGTYKETVTTDISDNIDSEYEKGKDIGNDWEIVSMDMNIVTSVQKTFTFGKNGDDKNIYVTFTANDNSNNEYSNQTDSFTIDRVAPKVTSVDFKPSSVDGNDHVSDFIERLEYGYYFKDSFTIVANCEDTDPSSGLNKVDFNFVTYKDGEKVSEKTESVNIENGKASYTVPAGFKGQIFLTPYDNANNHPDAKTTQAYVAENKAPEITIAELPSTNKKDDAGNNLYTGKVQFKVTITDTESGLREIAYSKSSDLDSFSAKKTTVDNTANKAGNILENGWKIDNMDNNLVTQVSQIFVFDKDDKNIYLSFEATDRSKNKSSTKNSQKFTIDTVRPTVDKFTFEPASADNISETEKFIELLEYGYYFKKSFNAVVTLDDAIPSSGLDKVSFRLVAYDKGELISEEIHDVDVKNKKAAYTIPAGFKGQVYAQAYDLAVNKSSEETPQAFVVDETAPEITIEPLPDNKSKTDMDGHKLYTGIVKFKVTISDKKSGLREIVYSKNSEKDSYGNVVTQIDNTLGYNKDSTIDNGWQVTKTDRNLVTEVSQVFTFSTDDNNIVMSFNATDRSKNRCRTSKNESFTIDTTAPVVQITYPQPINGKYYKDSVSFNIRVTERNFDPALMIKEIKDTYKGNDPMISYATDPDNKLVHTATVVFPSGDYTFNYKGEDRGANEAQIYDNGNMTSYFYKSFNVDDEAPVINTNFGEFVVDGKKEYYFNKTKTAKIEILEHNFYAYDMGISVERKAAGSSHNVNDDNWYETGSYSSSWKTEANNPDKHILDISFAEDAVYRITVSPVDRAGNKANTVKSAVFEIDKTVPVLYSRNGLNSDESGFVVSPYYEVYDEKKKDTPAPSVKFEDINFDRLKITTTVYKPEYIHGNEIISIKKDELSNELTKTTYEKDFNLNNYFNDDGVYVITYVAYDKAGNACVEVNDTYFRMVNTDVLAYISDSNLSKHTGYYSLMDEDGKAISKKAADFKDLDIRIITKKGDNESGTIIIRDEKQQYVTDEYSTNTEQAISETAVMKNVHLSGSYFSETFKDDSLDARMYLSVMYKDTPYDLATIHIDNEKPTADLPSDFVNWHNYLFTDETTITLTNISETLNKDLCKVYECPRDGDRTEIEFNYNKDAKTLSFILKEGLHNIDITLVDEAGNEWNVDRVKYLRVGNFRLYLGIGAVVVIAGVVVTIVLLRKRKRNKKAQNQDNG